MNKMNIQAKMAPIKDERNKAGYTAVRCVISSLAPSLVTPFPALFITSYHFPSPCAIPSGLNGRKDAFLRI